MQISTHSPRVGRDHTKICKSVRNSEFQPTLPVWGETFAIECPAVGAVISTHSPRVGRDACDFVFRVQAEKFQPTLPVWGETCRHLMVQ